MITTKEEYDKLKASGMMWEFYPDFCGEWDIDKIKIQSLNNPLSEAAYYSSTLNKKDMPNNVQPNDTFMVHEQKNNSLFDQTRCPICGKLQFECGGCILKSLEQKDKVNDVVNHPAHYASGKIECIEAIEEATKDLTGIEAVCTANVLKYSWRWKKKNGIEDLKKASWYLNKLISKLEDEQKG